MKPTYILVADNVRARIFTAAAPASPLEEIEALAHAEGRLHDRDITSDLPGFCHSSNTQLADQIPALARRMRSALSFGRDTV